MSAFKDHDWRNGVLFLSLFSFLVSALLNPQKPSEDASDEEDDIVAVYKNYQMHHIRGPDDRPDDPNFRYLLWKAMNSFPEVCEPKSMIVTPLFFNFLE